MQLVNRGIRNAFRNAIRTLSIVTILGLSIGLCLTMLVANRAVNKKIESVKSSIGNTVTVTPAGFQGMQGGGEPLTNDQIKELSKLEHVTGTESKLTDRLTPGSNTDLDSAIDAGSLGQRFGNSGEGRIQIAVPDGGASGDFKPPIQAIGTTNAGSLNGTTLKLTSGKTIDAAKDETQVLVGKDLAEKNNLKVGDTFKAYDTTLTIAGIYDTGTLFSNNGVIFSLATLQRLSGQTNNVTSATVTVDSINNIDSVTSVVKDKLGSKADVTNSKENAEEALAPLKSIKDVSLYSLIGAVVAGGVIILLTMIMIVRERQREIGVLKAIGGSNSRIMGQFIVEALTLTILGAVIGVVIGVAGGSPITKALVNNAETTTSANNGSNGGRPVIMQGSGGGTSRAMGGPPRIFGSNSTLRNARDVQAEIGWGILAYGFGAALLIAAFGSAIAAGMIAKVRPAQVMRSE